MFRKQLMEIGITPNLKGFRFLNEAIQLWDDDLKNGRNRG